MQAEVPDSHTAARKFSACDACYRRKIKCDGARPRCNWCFHQGSECTYARPTPRRVAKQGQAKSTRANRLTLRERIQRLDEGRILNINTLQARAPNLLPEGLRWIQSRTGVISSLSIFHHAPRRILVITHAQDSPCHFDSTLFSSKIQAAYPTRSSGPRTQNPSSRACVFAFMAFVSCLGDFDTSSSAAQPLSIPCKEYIMQARSLLPSIVQEPLNLDALQTALLLAIINTLIGEAQTAVYDVSIAARFIIALDKDLALRTSQAHVLKDDNCALDIPVGHAEHLHSCLDHSPGTEADIRGPISPVDLRLSRIKFRAFTALHSHNGLRKTDTELIRSIRELDEELECWRISLHLHLSRKKSKNTFLILTHMNYYSCVNFIHLASSRRHAWRSHSAEDGALIDGLQSSLTLSVGASRSLLLFLRVSGQLHVFFFRRGNPMDRVIYLQPISDPISNLREHAHQVIRGT
ncbi:uncharacterized protein BDV14DRAFT_210896 [Aspergillus stella-maris]|uniref:uncharacterized protein n=1 Tax=Aspergillus stella-maris TaxID=1810926 RepID=UPI003CCE4026